VVIGEWVLSSFYQLGCGFVPPASRAAEEVAAACHCGEERKRRRTEDQAIRSWWTSRRLSSVDVEVYSTRAVFILGTPYSTVEHLRRSSECDNGALMRGIGLRNAMRAAISRRRRTASIRALHGFAAFVESAYANEGAVFERDGEAALLGRLSRFGFQLAIDAGANIGDWAHRALEAWPECRVHAFEVAPETFQKLNERLCAEQKRGRATLECLGLYDRPGTAEMYYYPERPEQTCDSPRHPNQRAVPFEAHLVTGDAYCDERAIGEVDFLKIDVEGAEYRVMQGFAQRLSSQRIHCLQFEYGAFAIQTKFLLLDYFKLLGETYWIGKIYPDYVEFCDYDWRMESFRFCNYCCVSKKRPELKKALGG
jgi:FkbM family methyltransferase